MNADPGTLAADTTVVRLEGVAKSYPGQSQPALRPMSLDIRQGEFLSLLGPSGSGKTTTLRLIGGFEAPDSGRIILDGRDVTGLPANRRDVNTVFQNYALFPHLTVAGNVAYPLEVRGVPRSDIGPRVADALRLVELTGYEQRLPHALSGGQRQRVALARALVGRPRVLLLDEPLGALDLRLRVQMQSVLTHLQRETGITFVFVTHDHGEALAMSDRIAVMCMGGISQIGTPQEVYYRPANRFVAAFIGTGNVIEGAVDATGIFRAPGLALRLPGTPTGRPVTAIAVRCEAVQIADGGGDSLPVTVTETTFQGEITELVCAAGPTRLVVRAGSMALRGIRRGAALHLRIPPESVVVLHD